MKSITVLSEDFMVYIYLDESGDLGFDLTKQATSKHFVVTCLVVENDRVATKIVKKAFRKIKTFKKKKFQKHSGTLHCHKESPIIRRHVLNLLTKENVQVMTLVLDKQKVYVTPQEEKQQLYNFVTNALLDAILSQGLIPSDQKITILASQRETHKLLNEKFKAYLTHHTKQKHGLDIAVDISPHRRDEGLQVVDFLCWSVFRSHEHEDDEYRKIFERLIVLEHEMNL